MINRKKNKLGEPAPGEWKVDKTLSIVSEQKPYKIIATVNYDNGEGEANANHIVNCVNTRLELVTVLKHLREALSGGGQLESRSYCLGTGKTYLRMIKEVIKKGEA